MDYTFKPLADADLDEIWLHIAQENAVAADNMILKLFGAIDLLVQMPLMGRGRPELLPLIRSYAVTPYVIFYMPQADVLEIVRIFHGARDIEGVLH